MGDLYSHSVQVEIDGGPSTLELNDGANIRLVDWNPPLAAQWNRVAAEGPYQAGRKLISAVPATVVLTGAVRIYGTDWSNQQAWLAAFQAALSQFSYALTETLEGVTRTWACEPADITLADGGLDPFGVNRSRQVYVFQIPATEVTA